jgi:hypothetical protein
MKHWQTTVFRILATVFLAGCAAAPPAVERREIAAPPPPPPVLEERAVPRNFEDRDLFLKGMELLARAEAPDFGQSRALFVSLAERYPQSRWRPAAETLIRLIDEKQTFREALLEEGLRLQQTLQQTQAERNRLLQENEQLRKSAREAAERLQAEKTGLSQENEQLRKDLKRLKDLEIEIEKRERMLR